LALFPNPSIPSALSPRASPEELPAAEPFVVEPLAPEPEPVPVPPVPILAPLPGAPAVAPLPAPVPAVPAAQLGADVPEVPARVGCTAYPLPAAPAVAPQVFPSALWPSAETHERPLATLAPLFGCADEPAEADTGCTPPEIGGGAVSALT